MSALVSRLFTPHTWKCICFFIVLGAFLPWLFRCWFIEYSIWSILHKSTLYGILNGTFFIDAWNSCRKWTVNQIVEPRFWANRIWRKCGSTKTEYESSLIKVLRWGYYFFLNVYQTFRYITSICYLTPENDKFFSPASFGNFLPRSRRTYKALIRHLCVYKWQLEGRWRRKNSVKWNEPIVDDGTFYPFKGVLRQRHKKSSSCMCKLAWIRQKRWERTVQ